MNFKFYPLKALLLALLLLGFKARTQAQAALDFVKTVENFSTGGDGSTAMVGNILIYTITVKNLTATNYVASKLYDNVPGGVAYIANSTTLNGAAVADNSGLMPYAGSGKYINSPTYGTGILAPNVTATIIFRVKVTANGGNIFNNATVEGTQGGVATIQATNTVTTAVTVDAACNVVYQVTPADADNNNYHSYLRTLNTTDGTGGTTLAQGPSGAGATQQKEAFSPYPTIKRPGDPGGGAKVELLDGSAAIAYDRDSNRIYFVNNTTSQPPLCYIDLDDATPTIYRCTGYPLETSTCGTCNVNRMGKGSDGYFYALTSGAQDLIRFSISAGNVPVITSLGTLTNASSNGAKNILSEGGGDLFADGSGKLYLIANSSNMYKINPNTRVAVYMGQVNPFPGTSQSLAIDANGVVYINGNYNDVYKLDLQTMAATAINVSQTNVYRSGDYSACGFPVLASSIIANKTYKNINGSSTIVGGDTVEYSITVTNIGNINAAGVYMYDYIPPSTTYLTHTTKINDSLILDASGGVMPYAVSGGKLVMTYGELPGIVKPGAASAAVVKFQVVTEPNKQVCNQSKISLLDADGNVMFVNSNDPTNVGQTPTCFYSDGVLPLTNLKFKGSLNDNKSVLNWTMNGDENVATYEVEYSENGTVFSTTGKVAGKGTISANSYQFTDVEHTFSTIRYYRIKVVQKGGSYSYSGIIRLNANDLDVEAVPNPFDRDINVQIRLKTAENVRIRLVDLLGKEVYSTTENLGIGSHSISIRIPAGLAKGMYLLDVKAGNDQVFQKKLLKK